MAVVVVGGGGVVVVVVRNKSQKYYSLARSPLRLPATTRNAETPPNFVPKTLQNRAQKVPNVPPETLEKKRTFSCLCDNRLVASCRVLSLSARLMATTRNAETPPNFVPKTRQNRAQKLPNVPSESLEKQYSFGQRFYSFRPMFIPLFVQ